MRELSAVEIGNIVTEFAQGARRVQQAGWDGVQLHGAHGYLLSSFLSPYTNKRTDSYGGSLENRVRIIKEIVEQTRLVVGEDFPILIRVNATDNVSGGIDIDGFPALGTGSIEWECQ